MIELYTSPTPNGYKASIALEEMAIPYNVHATDRFPAIVDTDEGNLAVFKSGAIMIYLALQAVQVSLAHLFFQDLAGCIFWQGL